MSRRRRALLVKDPNLAVVLALGAQVAAVVLFHDAYDARGKDRPLGLKILSGLGG